MTQEQIKEGNKLIAEFLELRKTLVQIHNQNGSIQNAEPEWCVYGVDENKDTFKDSELKFHSSWNWLMPVIKKVWNHIEQFQYDDEEYLHITEDIFHPDYTLSEFMNADIEALWERVIRIIKYYNENICIE